MSSYYNNIPIYETINVNYGNIETLDTTTLKAKNLYIDNVKTSDKLITQNLTLDTDNIESLSKASTAPYTSDNNKITSKGYVDEAINNIPSTDLSECVKNNIDQTLTNKFIMNNSNNEFTTNKIIINSNEINNIDKVSGDTTADNKTIYTKKKVDTIISGLSLGVGQLYPNSTYGEIFNDYTNNIASGEYSHAEGFTTKALGNYSHAEGRNTTASGSSSHTEGYYSKASNSNAHAEGYNTTASGSMAHAEGYNTTASGSEAHAEGNYTIASGNYSHAGGTYTNADQENQTAIGICNTTNNTKSILSVGNGTADDARSDAFVVKSTGEVIINSTATNTTPSLTIGTSKGITGTTATSSSTNTGDDIITTKYYVDDKTQNCITTSNILFTNCTIRIRYLTTSTNVWMPKDISTFGIFFFKSQTEVYFTGDLYIDTLPDINTTKPEVYIEYIQYKPSVSFCVPESGTPHNQLSLLYAITPDSTTTVAICYLTVERNKIASHPWNLYLIKYVLNYDSQYKQTNIGYVTTSSNIMIKLNYVYFEKLE